MILSGGDIALIIVFVMGSILLGLWASRSAGKSSASYLLADKNVSLPVFIMTNVATWYGGILGVGEFSYQYGILNWFTQGLPYYIFAILYAFLLAGKIKLQPNITIPSLINGAYGEKSAILTSVFIFILTSPAPYILMTAYIFVHVFGMSILTAVLTASAVTIIYLYKGGYKSDIITDIYFFFVMFIGFACVLFYFVNLKGGIDYLTTNLPQKHLEITGGAGWGYIIVWYLIAIWTFADPGFFQRVQSTRSTKVARYGILLSIVLWFIFDLLTNGIGLYARALMPDLKNSADVFLQLADQFIPNGLRGIFYIGMFATILSTLNSFFFISAVTFAQDIITPLQKMTGMRKTTTGDKDAIRYVRIGLIVTGILASGLALVIPSVISLWYAIGSLCIPPVVFILLSVFYPALIISKTAALVESLLSFASGALWWYARSSGYLTGFWFEIEPMVFALLIALMIHALALFKKSKP
ncbi:MAG: sodium:solute symporter family protein [Ignavibacteriales bacterium]|nr:sodium:solute symporter family protein [Ignavibacteriales bacterium]